MKLIDLYNPNKYTIPVTIKNGQELTQVKVNPREHIQITSDQITDSVITLTKPVKRMLTKTVIQ